MMVHSKDPLTAAATRLWAPLLRKHGFREYTGRSFGRVTNDCVFQYINLEQSALRCEDFAVIYTSVLITRPRKPQEHVRGRLRLSPMCRSLMSHQGWWSVKTHEQADESMQEICEKTINIALPWFQSTSTALGLAQELVIQGWTVFLDTLFELGCCYVTAGDLAAAVAPLQEVIWSYQEQCDRANEVWPEPMWQREVRTLAEELVAAIANGTHENLLSRWRDQTVANLKLEKVRS